METTDQRLIAREILLGFWKVHILHHAAEQPVVGQWVFAELRRHGYEISPGTLYPLLKRMERNGWLRGTSDPAAGPRSPRFYRLTSRGRKVLKVARAKVGELYGEVVEHETDRTGYRSSHLSQPLHANRPERLNLARSAARRPRQRRKR